MKKNFLLMIGLLLSTVTAFAQWVSPVEGEDFTTEGQHYLYNVEYKGFYCGDNSWGTRASVSRGEWKNAEKAKKFLYLTLSEGAEEGLIRLGETSPDGLDGVWMDGSRDGNDQFFFTQIDGGKTFTIGCAKFPDTYLTWGGLEDNTELNLTETAAGGTWMLVSQDEFNELTTGSKKGQYESFVAAVALKAAMDKAEAECPGIDLSSQKAVYNNTESTKEQLNGATAEVANAVDLWKKSQIDWAAGSVNTPVDITSLLINPGFDNETYEGWAGTGYGKGGTTGPCAERYEMIHDTYQKVSNVKPGVYVVKMDGFFRNGSTANAFDTKGQPSYAYLYGTNGVDTLKTPIMGLFDGIVPEDPVEGVTFTYETNGETYYIPNSMKDACAFFDAGKYKDNTVYFGVTGDELAIGTFMKEKKTADWMLVDNFRLAYLGAEAEAYQKWNTEATANTKVYDATSTTITASVLDAYNTTVAASKSGSDYETVVANMKAIDAAAALVDANIAAWKALNEQVVLCKTAANGLNGAEADILKDYLDFDIEDMINGQSASTEDILAEVANLKKMLDIAIENNLQPGSDVTDLIKNASFKSGFANWTKANGETPAGTLGGLKAFPCVEVYSNVVDVQQTVTGLPKGVYKLSCQAFERPSGNENIGKTWNVDTPSKVFLFMNSAETPVQNILADGIAEEKAVNYENSFFEGSIGEDYYSTGGTTNLDFLTDFATYIPNGMSGASYAFRAGRYYQEAAGLVTDGKMTIGLTSKGQTAHWVLWADFKLTFLGNDPVIVGGLVNDAIKALNTDQPYGTDVKETVDAAIATAKAALEAGDGNAMVDCLDALYQAKDPQAESIALFEELGAQVEEFGDVINDSEADDAIKAEATAFWASLADLSGMTNAQAKNAAESLNLYKNKLAIPAGYESATEENPVEMTGLIQNADIEAGATVAWQHTKNGGNGPALTGGIEGASIEFWNGTAANLEFNIWQEITYLPEGAYTLKADIANSLNGQAENGETGYAALYIMQDSVFNYSQPVVAQEEGCVDAWNNYSVTMNLKEGKATVGVQSVKESGKMQARWIVIDNFQLFYLGKDYVDGIETVTTAGSTMPVAIFDINGARIASLKKGVNLVKIGNGQVRKVLVK